VQEDVADRIVEMIEGAARALRGRRPREISTMSGR
jgi:delta 1-pyrroline-5-carboxylate dehydrogenase